MCGKKLAKWLGYNKTKAQMGPGVKRPQRADRALGKLTCGEG
jgi:hypothetical protein